MAELGTSQSSGLFQDWYDRYVKPKKAPATFPPDPFLSLPASPIPTPSATVPSPAGDPQFQEEHALDVAEGNQDQWTGPTPGPPTAAPSITDRFNAGLSRVGEGLKDPAKMGLLATGLSMMATPPRQVPYSNTEILGNAGLSGLKYYEKALESKRKGELMKQTTEEHTLAREDRRTATEQRNEYYMGNLADRKAAQATRDAIASDAMLKNKRDTEPIGENQYGVSPETPMWKVKDLTGLQKQLNTPDKETKPDAFTKWYESFGKAGPTKKDLENWHRSPGVSGGGTDSGPGKVGAIGQINRELVAMYLPHAKEGLSSKGPAGMEEYKGMVAMFQTTDQFGGTVNDARLRESLSVDQRKEYDFVKRKAQDYSRTMTPANAVARAQGDWKAKNPGAPAKPPAAVPVKPGAAVKKVRMPDGTVQEFDAAGNRVR